MLRMSFCVLLVALPAASAQAELPEFEAVKAAVLDVVRQQKDYQPDDLITRKQVRAMLDRIERLGWKLKDRGALEARVLDDGSYLAGKLRTSSGKKFMRQIAPMNMGYDRLDRLSQLPQGRSTVDRLIQGPDGYKLMEYMADAKGGRELGKMLSKDGGGNFNQPTGKLYTAEQLTHELEAFYDLAAAEAARHAKP